MKFIDYDKKELHWWNKNYFWVISILYIILNISIHAIFNGNNILWPWVETRWSIFNGIKDLMVSFANLYTHGDWGHVLANMVAFSIASFYLERKIGSLYFFALLQVMSIFASSMTSMYASFYWAGSSVLYYGVWGYVVIDYLFSLKDKNKTNNIIGLISIICIYIGCCLTPNIVGSTLEPINLIYNAGHYYGFIVGLIVSTLVNIVKLETKRSIKTTF